MSSRYCTSCGAPADPSSAFCSSCGYAFEADGDARSPVAPTMPRASVGGAPFRAWLTQRKVILAALAVSTLLLGPLVLAGWWADLGGADDWPPVETQSQARHLVQQVLDAAYSGVVSGASSGSHEGTIIEGESGRAILRGHKSGQHQADCGRDCLSSRSNVDLTITFESFSFKRWDFETTVEGTVRYTDNRWSRQSGLQFSSGGEVTLGGSDVAVVYTSEDTGRADVLTFSISRPSATNGVIRGSCTTSSGDKHVF